MPVKELAIIIQPVAQVNTSTLSFLDILLDETLIYGKIYISKACFSTVSFLNHRLPAKEAYELVLRLAQEYPILLSNTAPSDLDSYFILLAEEPILDQASLQTDCYIISRYKKILLEQELFDAAVESILMQADSLGCREHILTVLSDMLQEQEAYLYYDLGSAPFLIYTGDTVCYHILSIFAEELGKALRTQGYLVEYFDLSKKDFTNASELAGRKYQAVIGIQSYMFSLRLANNVDFLHDQIIGPKYNFVLDHPVRFENHLKQTPQHLTILTPDRNYAAFAETFYPVKARFLPPGGIEASDQLDKERIYDVTFIATYNDISTDIFKEIHNLEPAMRFLINRLWIIMRRNPTLTAEDALSRALLYYGKNLEDAEFLSLFQNLQPYILYMVNRYRCKVLETLLNAGIKVDVYGKSWLFSSLKEHPCFIWHNEDLSTEECLKVWQQSKIVLNVMSWHKDAITERILNSMLQKAVVVTERNPYMEASFSSGEDLILYDLTALDVLPEQVKNALENPALLSHIAEQGYQKAHASHTWSQRAATLVNICALEFIPSRPL